MGAALEKIAVPAPLCTDDPILFDKNKE